jgi:hypothetical protein
MLPLDSPSLSEDLVLQVFKLRHIRDGFGLVYTVIQNELKDHPALDLPATIVSLLAKDYLRFDPNIPAFFILTKKGFNHISQTP